MIRELDDLGGRLVPWSMASRAGDGAGDVLEENGRGLTLAKPQSRVENEEPSIPVFEAVGQLAFENGRLGDKAEHTQELRSTAIRQWTRRCQKLIQVNRVNINSRASTLFPAMGAGVAPDSRTVLQGTS